VPRECIEYPYILSNPSFDELPPAWLTCGPLFDPSVLYRLGYELFISDRLGWASFGHFGLTLVLFVGSPTF
jgi:hypothetical protein